MRSGRQPKPRSSLRATSERSRESVPRRRGARATDRSPEQGGHSFRIRSAAFDDIIAHAREARPNECCGLLLGNGTRIERAYRARNLEDRPTRFLIDPRDHFAAIRAARESVWAILGVYHSHPFSSALPSPSDVAEASYAGYLYLIVGLDEHGASPDVRAFRFEDGRFVEQTLIFET